MRRAGAFFLRLLRLPAWAQVILLPAAFGAAGYCLAAGRGRGAAAYVVYALAAYALAVLIADMPGVTKRVRWVMMESKPAKTPLAVRFRADAAFRVEAGLWRSMAVSGALAVFHGAACARYGSVWFGALAAYDVGLAALRAGIALPLRRGAADEWRVYRRTGARLLLLNVPMGGMIALMVRTNSGYSYPGFVIYVSAMYAFYAMAMSVRGLARFRRAGSPVLSAAKAVNFVAAMMSMLGMQTAMIARFSGGDERFRQMMNGAAGVAVWAGTIAAAAVMLRRGAREGRKGG